jgi:hypothetical protein
MVAAERAYFTEEKLQQLVQIQIGYEPLVTHTLTKQVAA